MFITLNNVRIARKEEDGTWTPLQPRWKVTKARTIEVHVRLYESDGVILPYPRGRQFGR
jgi:hypothetical protein